jgi:ribosomal silencing factor RsfS
VVVEGDADSQWIIVNMTDIQVRILQYFSKGMAVIVDAQLWRQGRLDSVHGSVASIQSIAQVHLLDAVMRERLELEKLWTLGPDDDQLRDLIDSQPEYFI